MNERLWDYLVKAYVQYLKDAGLPEGIPSDELYWEFGKFFHMLCVIRSVASDHEGNLAVDVMELCDGVRDEAVPSAQRASGQHVTEIQALMEPILRRDSKGS